MHIVSPFSRAAGKFVAAVRQIKFVSLRGDKGPRPGRSGVTSPNVCRSLQALTEGFFCFAQRSRWASAIFFLASALSRRRFRPGFDDADCEEAFAVLEPESSWRTLFSVAISSLMEAMMLLTSMVLLYRYQTIKRLGQGSGPLCSTPLAH